MFLLFERQIEDTTELKEIASKTSSSTIQLIAIFQYKLITIEKFTFIKYLTSKGSPFSNGQRT